MNNTAAQQYINDCNSELAQIDLLIQALGQFNNTVPYLTKYAIIKACGTVEQCFKTIVADHNSQHHSPQIRNYVDETIRKSSMNPSYDNICNTLKKFDLTWLASFKTAVNNHPDKAQINTSLSSLNEERNKFAHGGQPTSSFTDVKGYFLNALTLITILDSAVV